eukprot:CAMPEP_0205800828 /NCGR_PEP_ID=MMETSP0205-20121125/2611_1 /ASSEMBLY_ACC=CAM_ASM_000278 /TAXON_ID=36767 /ORGANISM="Euplotes focardii, Strain TN1" /LENGTH=193 /DNA_ID=CAMNT_0053064555 /DNA_START=1556 /DNA_END=2137 /DNA_ORIENTATION=+
MITRAGGDLKCDYVIHTVGPVYNKKKSDSYKECQQLVSAVESCLTIMKKKKFTQISIPAISSGIYGMPIKLCVGLFAKAIKNCIDEDPQFFKEKDIILCNFDDETTDAFQTHFENEINKVEDEDEDEDNDDDSNSEEEVKETKSRKRREQSSDEESEEERPKRKTKKYKENRHSKKKKGRQERDESSEVSSDY